MKVPGIDKDFLEEMKKIVTEADDLLVERGNQYNQGGVTLHDQHKSGIGILPRYSYWAILHIRFFRLKSLMQGIAAQEEILETLRDLLNEVRFLYASIKCNK